jgi:rod shape-determining protein MreC
MAVYRQDRRRRITLVMLIITSLVLITLDQQGTGVVASLRSTAQDVISPLQDVADTVISPVTDFFDSLGRGNELEAENERLRRDVAGLKSEIAANKSTVADAQGVKELVDLPDIADYDSVFASVVDGSTGNFERTFQIDRGSDDGIGKDMAVVVGLHGGALVGKVTSVSKSRATVQRIDDAQFGVGVQLLDPSGSLGPTGFAQGSKDSALLDLQLSTSSQKLVKGEFAITRGLGESPFPRGLAVGTIVRGVDPSTATAERASLRPIVDLDTLNIVKVLRYRPVVIP